MSFRFPFLKLWAIVFRAMVVGPVVLLLTLIRLVLCVQSLVYHRKEKFLDAVVVQLIEEKCLKDQ